MGFGLRLTGRSGVDRCAKAETTTLSAFPQKLDGFVQEATVDEP
jgi:hypothetical protein